MPSPPLERARPTTAREYQTLVRNRLIESRLTPNAISLTGLVLCLVAAGLIFADHYFLGGLAFIIGSVCDTLDGRYSRMSGKGSLFGAFLDSTLDRVEEGVVIAAVAWHFADAGEVAGAHDHAAGRVRANPTAATAETAATAAPAAASNHQWFPVTTTTQVTSSG